jgi:hypothetical protein
MQNKRAFALEILAERSRQTGQAKQRTATPASIFSAQDKRIRQ